MNSTATRVDDTEILERLAVELDSTPVRFEDETAAWLTERARSERRTEHLAAIMNDEANTRPVRSRAMSVLTGELLRARSHMMHK